MHFHYKYLKINLLFALVIILPKNIMAQSSQLQPVAYFMYNKLLYNPASAGTGASRSAGRLRR